MACQPILVDTGSGNGMCEGACYCKKTLRSVGGMLRSYSPDGHVYTAFEVFGMVHTMGCHTPQYVRRYASFHGMA